MGLGISRRPGKKIIIDEQIVITYLGHQSAQGGKFNVEAPPHISVRRDEVPADAVAQRLPPPPPMWSLIWRSSGELKCQVFRNAEKAKAAKRCLSADDQKFAHVVVAEVR